MPTLTQQLLWIAFAFLLGALPFSVWIGRIGLKTDIRDYGDNNPGATNVMRAGSRGLFFVAMLLDIAKGALPVGLAYQQWGWRGWPMFLVAMAPPIGHAFSPLLKFRGGKALATMFGVWIGLSMATYSVPVILMLIIWMLVLDNNGWATLLAVACLVGILFWRDAPLLFVFVALGQMALSVVKQWEDIRHKPHLSSRLVGRKV